MILGADDLLDVSGGGDHEFSAAVSNKTFVVDGDAGDALTLGLGVLPSGAWHQNAENVGLDGAAGGDYDIFNSIHDDGTVLATIAIHDDFVLI